MDGARRLRKGREFDTVYQKGTALSGPLLALRHLPNDEGVIRWGFAVGKRLAKKSHDRNLVRRRLREAARHLPVQPGHDIVVTARKGAVEASYAELAAALERVLKRARLLDEAEVC